MDIKGVFLQQFIKFLQRMCAKKFTGSGIRNENISYQKLAEKLRKNNYLKIQEKKSTINFYYQSIKLFFSGANLDDIQLNLIKGFVFYCVLSL